MSNSLGAPLCDFPSDILKWMKQNAAPKMAVKLMQCHKCFKHFPEFPYLVVNEIGTEDEDDDEWWYCDNFGKHEFEGAESILDVEKKFWITSAMCLMNTCLTPTLISKIAVCDVTDLALHNQELSFDEFKFLTASGTVTNIVLKQTTIKFENGDHAYFADILKCVPNVEKFHYNHEHIPLFCSNFFNTFKDIETSKLKKVNICMLSFSDFVLFSKFMDHNPYIQYRIQFIDGSLSAVETEIVEEYVQRIIDNGITEDPSPIIYFPGQSSVQYHFLLIYEHDL